MAQSLSAFIASPAAPGQLGGILRICYDNAGDRYARMSEETFDFINQIKSIMVSMFQNDRWTGSSVMTAIRITNGRPNLPQSTRARYRLPHGVVLPLRVRLFLELPAVITLNPMDDYDFAYFCYHNPLTWDMEDDKIFLLKLFELRNRNKAKFDSDLVLDGSTDMHGWHSRFVNVGDVLDNVLNYNQAVYLKFYQNDEHLVGFVRNCFQHFHGTNNNLTTAAFMNIHFYPFLGDVVPKAFLGMLRGNIYRNSISTFRIKLIRFFRLSPLPIR